MTDRRSIAVLSNLRLIQDRLRDVAVVRDRHARGSADAEGDDPDAVILPAGDEIPD